MNVRFARNIGPLSSHRKKVTELLCLIDGRTGVWCCLRTVLFKRQIQIGRFTLEREHSKTIDCVAIEISNQSASAEDEAARERRGDLTLSNFPGFGRQRPSLMQCKGHCLQPGHGVLVDFATNAMSPSEATEEE